MASSLYVSTKRLVLGTTGCTTSASSSTFFSAMMVLTRSRGIFVSAKLKTATLIEISVTVALSTEKYKKQTRCFGCPYTAVGFVLGKLKSNLGMFPVVKLAPTLTLVYHETDNVVFTVENAVKTAGSACGLSLNVEPMAPLSFLVKSVSSNTALLFIEIQYCQFMVASIDGLHAPIVVGYAPEETVDETSYKWTMHAVSNWTECQLCVAISSAMSEVVPPRSSLLDKLLLPLKMLQK